MVCEVRIMSIPGLRRIKLYTSDSGHSRNSGIVIGGERWDAFNLRIHPISLILFINSRSNSDATGPESPETSTTSETGITQQAENSTLTTIENGIPARKAKKASLTPTRKSEESVIDSQPRRMESSDYLTRVARMPVTHPWVARDACNTPG